MLIPITHAFDWMITSYVLYIYVACYSNPISLLVSYNFKSLSVVFSCICTYTNNYLNACVCESKCRVTYIINWL